MVEHVHGKHEVTGSTPLSGSTPSTNNLGPHSNGIPSRAAAPSEYLSVAAPHTPVPNGDSHCALRGTKGTVCVLATRHTAECVREFFLFGREGQSYERFSWAVATIAAGHISLAGAAVHTPRLVGYGCGASDDSVEHDVHVLDEGNATEL